LGGRTHVAVLDPLPLFQRGVVEALRSDEIRFEMPTDIRAWVAQSGQRVVILTLASPEDWALLEQLSAKTLVIAVLEENTAPLSIRALRLGAGSVVPRSATTAVMRRALEAALAGDAIVSRSVVRSLISSSRLHESSAPQILEEEVLWLRQLASGMTVARLATLAGYSERAMYRLLNSIYDRLGVTNRTEALMKANAYGWLGTET
jgi:DNA-binding NarL/FixJ family response regulator